MDDCPYCKDVRPQNKDSRSLNQDLTRTAEGRIDRPADRTAASAGPFRFARTPYLVDIHRPMSPGAAWREGWWMKPYQVGGSVAGENLIGARVCTDVGSMLTVFPPCWTMPSSGG